MNKFAFVFPGLGAQFVGMGKAISEEFDIARNTYEEANDVLGFDLASLCFSGKLMELSKTVNASTAILTNSVALYRVFMQEIGINPQFVAGHSLGEYSAFTCSGAWSFADALRIVKRRSELAEKLASCGEYGMTLIDMCEKQSIIDECKALSNDVKKATVSCFNTSRQIAVSGNIEVVNAVEDFAIEKGWQFSPFASGIPFHSTAMSVMAEDYQEVVDSYALKNLRYPVLLNVTGEPSKDIKDMKKECIAQLLNPVRWEDSIKYMNSRGVMTYIELGPKPMLVNLIHDIIGTDCEAICYSNKSSRKELKDMVNNDPRLLKQRNNFIGKCLAAAVATPNLSDNDADYETDVVTPYRELVKLNEIIGKEKRVPDVQEKKRAISLLQTIFANKNVDENEQSDWLDEIYEETGSIYEMM